METPKLLIKKYRLTFVTKGGNVITTHRWNENGNTYVEVFRNMKTLGIRCVSDPDAILKTELVAYGSSSLKKKPYVNFILAAENGVRWEINFLDSVFDPISHEVQKGIIPGL